jgi:hypothetical protein
MSVAGIQVGAGITAGAGISLGNIPTITITSSDFTYGAGAGGTTEYITNGGGDLICPFYYMNGPVGNIATRLSDFFTACGYDINTSYVFRATFASATPDGGSLTTPYSCLVRADYNSGSSQLDLTVIDQTNTNWTSGNPGSGTMLQGAFTLPVTLTPYSPTVSMGAINWC